MPQRTTHRDASFSGHFGIARTSSDDWFDPLLHTDTELFIDPFLAFDDADPRWSSMERKLVKFFNEFLLQVAAAGTSMGLVPAAMVSFPEPREFCFGYGKKTILGSGAGRKMGSAMLAAAKQAIQAGIQNVDDFGQLLLFGEGMADDRVSDMICNVVKSDFIDYTQQVAAEHGIPTEAVPGQACPLRLRTSSLGRCHVQPSGEPVLDRNTCLAIP